uniref:Uncharacterized protein n=1 Tax=Syphacia muris TaxID=451379 RepID=A0A0N5AVY2_9BILA
MRQREENATADADAVESAPQLFSELAKFISVLIFIRRRRTYCIQKPAIYKKKMSPPTVLPSLCTVCVRVCRCPCRSQTSPPLSARCRMTECPQVI